MIHNLFVWAESHLGALGAAGSIFTMLAGWIGSKVPGFFEKEVSLGLDKVFSKIQNPKIKSFLITVDNAAAEAVPDAGDAKYAVLTDAIIKECPEAAPARDLILAILTGIGAGAKAGMKDTIQAQKPA